MQGLTAREADDRLRRDGPNELPAAGRSGALQLLWEVVQFIRGCVQLAPRTRSRPAEARTGSLVVTDMGSASSNQKVRRTLKLNCRGV